MKSIGVFRTTPTTFASETNSHDNFLAMRRQQGPYVKPKVGCITSGQRCAILGATPIVKTLDRVDFGGFVTNDVKSAIRRVRRRCS